MRSVDQFEKVEEFENYLGNLNYEVIKYKDIIEKNEKKIKNKKKESEDLNYKARYLEKKLDEYKKENSNGRIS